MAEQIKPKQLYTTGASEGDVLKVTSGIAAWSAGGGGGVDTMGTFGSVPNAEGGSIAGTTYTNQPADGSFPGGVSTTTQSFAGVKTFNDGIDNGGNALTGLADGVNATDAATVNQIVAAGSPYELFTFDCSTPTTILVRANALYYESRVSLDPNGVNRDFNTALTPTLLLQTVPPNPIYTVILNVLYQAYTVTLYDNSINVSHLKLASGTSVVLAMGDMIAFALSDDGMWREMWRSIA
jgi:hypothetical protein